MSNVKAVTAWRRRTKLRAIEYKGGKCSRCGFIGEPRAMIFHHIGDKSFGIAHRGITRAWAKIQAELDKCILLCLNCHAEVHEVMEKYNK